MQSGIAVRLKPKVWCCSERVALEMQRISLLIADGDSTIRQCLRCAMECDQAMQVCWEADNGLQALALAQQHRPNVVLLDAQMPRMDGIEATRCLRQRDHDAKIIVIGVYESLRASAIAAGADMFLTKDSGCEVIRGAVRKLAARNAALSVEA